MQVTLFSETQPFPMHYKGETLDILKLALQRDCSIKSKLVEKTNRIEQAIKSIKRNQNNPTHTIKTVISAYDRSVTIKELLKLKPRIQSKLQSNIKAPVLISGNTVALLDKFNLDSTRSEAREKFKILARDMIRDDKHLFILNADKIACLRKHPNCIAEILDGFNSIRTITLIFGNRLQQKLEKYLQSSVNSFYWDQMEIQHTADAKPINWEAKFENVPDEIIKLENKRISLYETWVRETISSCLDRKESVHLENLSKEDLQVVFNKANKLSIKQKSNMVDSLRQDIIVEVLRNSHNSFSARTATNPTKFYKDKIESKMNRYGVAKRRLLRISPSIYHYIYGSRQKSKK